MRLGAHVSIAGGISLAVDRGVELKADCLQLFVSSPRVWRQQEHKAAEIALYREKLAAAAIGEVFIHTPYLLNFATADEELRNRSIVSLALTLVWAEQLGANGVITHLGSGKGAEDEEVEELVADSLTLALKQAGGETGLLLETSAGHTVGQRFDQLGRIIRRIDVADVGVCMDTCHVFAAGHDITSRAGLDRMLDELDRTVALERLVVVHANDSKTPLGSGVDRHQNIGLGFIGEEGFKLVLADERLRGLPFILEVPGFDGHGPDKENLAILRRLAEVAAT